MAPVLKQFRRLLTAYVVNFPLALPTLNPFRLRNLANKETPRQTGMAASDLAGWFDQVKGLSNPIMREYQMMTALTGRRRSAVASMKWEHVHVRDGRYIDFLTPKGVSSGRAKPDRIPISWPMLRVLARCRMAGRILCETQSQTWVFPSVRSKSGHIEEPKGKSRRRLTDGTVVVKQRIDTSPHALRHTWISLAPKIMSRVHAKILVGHKLAADVFEDYMTVDSMFDQLRDPQTKLQEYMLIRYRGMPVAH
jgi:integrase